MKATAHRLTNHVAVLATYIELLFDSRVTEEQHEMCVEMRVAARDALELCRFMESRCANGETL